LDDAIKEAALATQKVEQLAITMEEIKVNNDNNAVLYRAPDANLFSIDGKFKALGSKLTGDLARASGQDSLDASRGPASFGKRDERKTAASAEGEPAEGSEASKSTPGGTATSDDPWVNYMGQTAKTAFIERLRKNPSLRDSLRDRIAELQAKGDQSGVVELMEETLAAAEKESQEPSLDNLKPMTVGEAFSMDAGETEAQIRSLLADLDATADPQFLPQTSLFERISVAHRRSLVRGALKAPH
jgi:hypothetical protein